ncbi:unnamed protein product [Tuber aestivum]|uniref:Uncharacterized protein n=1 Tax=Tuber aestivum TaxID=59557 RepID=A0A292Q3D7_9PEZI|nr:unnamed protein product [Tuber aestivum]
MENRLPLRDTPRLFPLVPSDTDYDEDSRYSRSEGSVTFVADNIQPIQENVFATPPSSPRPSNVFATPVHSRCPSPVDLNRGDLGESTLAPSTYSIRRDSSFSSRRSRSPFRAVSGGYPPQHRVSSSLAPSIISNSSGHATGSGLYRSNTVATNTTNSTNSSTLYSIPSQLSQLSSPPSPLPSIAPVRPRFDYGGHQQSIYPLSVHSNSDISEPDPFGDGFEIPVGDGFAPHHQIQPPSIASTEPPPYSMYPDQLPSKPEERGIVADFRSNSDSGFSMGEDAEGHRDTRMVIPPLVVGADAGQVVGANGRGSRHPDDRSGAAKEWKEKRWLGIKARIVVLGLGIGLLVLLAVGLGVGLGMGLRKSSSTSVTVADMPPSSEETGPPISDPDNTFPDIKTGMAVLRPLMLSEISSNCPLQLQDRSSPMFFELGSTLLWSCQNSLDKPLVWRFDHFPPESSGVKMSSFPSHPEFLMGAEYGEGSWGGYMLSSLEGIIRFDDDWDVVVKDDNGQEEHSAEPGWRDGAQNPLFWHVPLAYYNSSTNNKRLNLRSNNSTPVGKFANYRFGILYDKTVVLKQNSIDQTLSLLKNTRGPPKFANGTALGEGDIVWKCVWEKTLLDVEISINQPSLARHPTGFGGDSGPPSHRGGDASLGDGQGGGRGDGRGDSRGSRDGFSDERGKTLSGSPPPPGGPPPQNSFNVGNGGQIEPPVTALAIPTPTGLNDSAGTDGAYEFSDIPTTGKIKRGETTLPYPLKITIEETRPSPKRLRRVMGMDLTDADPRGSGKPGDVKCTQMVVTRLGGLKQFMDANGEGCRRDGSGIPYLESVHVGGHRDPRRKYVGAPMKWLRGRGLLALANVFFTRSITRLVDPTPDQSTELPMEISCIMI